MLKIHSKPTRRLVDWKDWLLFRESMIFRDEEQLRRFQQEALSQICDYYSRKFSMVKPSKQLPPSRYTHNSMTLQTSGTNSTKHREYLYSNPQYEIIENHHFWRIEREYGLEAPGPIVELAYCPTYPTEKEYKDCYLEAANGGYNASGKHNPLHLLWFRRNTEDLTDVLKQARELRPKFVICSPCQLEFMHSRSEVMEFDCPVICTRETLYPHVRELGLRRFPKVIDKMRCWDGGLGFYECRYGRKHLYDELAYVEQMYSLGLASTDFFNYSTPFIRYLNSDVGSISKGQCDCGVYGNFLDSFEGKTATVLTVGDYKIAGSIIVEDVTSLIKFGGCSSHLFGHSMFNKYGGNPFEGRDILFRVKQKKDESIEFMYSSDEPLTDEQIDALRDGLNFIIYRHVGEGLEIAEKEKEFVSEPKYIVIKEEKELMGGERGLRHKSLCIESEIR